MIDKRIRALHLALEQRAHRGSDESDAIPRASVALLLRPMPTDLEVLLIERSHSAHDPWSGHMALPGGRRNPSEDALQTAVREVREEVGLDLDAGSLLLGQLDDVLPSPGGPRIAVSPFVFAVPAPVHLVPDPAEVASMVWIPLDHLADPASAARHLHALPDGNHRVFPAIAYDRYVIWGLTYRMLLQFLGVVRSAKKGDFA